MTVSLSSRDHQTNLGKRKNGRCEEDITKVSGKGWEQRVRSSVCYTHEGLSSALGYKLGERWCADLRRSLGNFTLPTSIPLFCNSAGKNVAVSRNSTRSHLPPGGSFWVSYYGVTDSLISQWGVILCAGGLQFALRQRDLRLSFVCRSIARTSKKSLLSAPWNICPTAALMAKHMATDAFSAMPTCTYKSKTLFHDQFLYLLQMQGWFHNTFLTNCLWAYTGLFQCTMTCARRWGFCILRENGKSPFLWSVHALLFVNFKDFILIFTST